jgi:hypothetical protein
MRVKRIPDPGNQNRSGSSAPVSIHIVVQSLAKSTWYGLSCGSLYLALAACVAVRYLFHGGKERKWQLDGRTDKDADAGLTDR